MEWINTLATLGSAAAVYFALKSSIRKDVDSMKNDIHRLDERIFQMAMGKSLKEILKEEKSQENK
jgi:predicted translin family RNA/ssDNA-binding protein